MLNTLQGRTMNYKTMIVCLLISGFAHKSLGMDTLGRALNSGATLVSNAYGTIKTKLQPLECLENFKKEWDAAKTRREQITLLQLAHRAFLDHHMAGFLQREPLGPCDLSKLVEHLEATKDYPISPLVHDTAYEFLNVKIPIIRQTRPELLPRTVIMYYLLQPRSLAADIRNNHITITLEKEVDREAVANTIMRKLLEKGVMTDINELMQALQKKGTITLNSSTQKDAKNILSNAIIKSFESIKYLDTLDSKNVDDPINKELKEAREYSDNLQGRKKAIEEALTREKQELEAKLSELVQRNAEIAAQKLALEKAALECSAQEQAIAQQEQQIVARAQQLEERKARLAAYIAEQQAKEQIYKQELEAAKAAEAPAPTLQKATAESSAAVQKKGGNPQNSTSVDVSSPQPSKQNANSNNTGKKG